MGGLGPGDERDVGMKRVLGQMTGIWEGAHLGDKIET